MQAPSQLTPPLSYLWILSRWAATFGGLAILCCAILVLLEVALRKFFNYSFAGVDEISGYVLAFGSALAFSLTLFRGLHIRVDAIYVLLPPRLRSLLDIMALASLAIFGALLSYYALKLYAFRLQWGSVSNTPLRVPLSIPMTPWIAGLLLFTFSSIFLWVHLILSHMRGRYQAVHELAEECRHQMLGTNASQAVRPAGES